MRLFETCFLIMLDDKQLICDFSDWSYLEHKKFVFDHEDGGLPLAKSGKIDLVMKSNAIQTWCDPHQHSCSGFDVE